MKKETFHVPVSVFLEGHKLVAGPVIIGQEMAAVIAAGL